ncbi:amino acid ABC transporter substrate-binding protein [Agrilactobacillus composti DSM 18527 = JCM 14202]|uniref:Lipoprotein n=1 Tax=Agrilactobacillus composti DSM 18527 = JCM 14202 TaxID=1423734 RepID=X0PFH4_9LACO|nr:MetQ/NlpA family ABC transporter substrate-binding protein [Agrilactobacillus composti]KRM35087.1 amino acid ABC transporter substrate-binding protein [Agrilactobacillus composti DSM 18527 = JCM 14202]GAF40468.1 methionine ABC transporter substrate-binding protein [Agrilactobacillus composti DSM 18527 = JCM 14202]
MKLNKKLGLIAAAFIGTIALGIFTTQGTTAQAATTETVGVAPGPYGDMTTEVLGPLLKKKGFTLKTKEFNDYVQPNKALNSGSINANLFQHTAYLKTFSAANKLELSAVGQTPTLGMGIYSKKIKSLKSLKSGATVAIANDPSNLARSLQLLAANKLITLKKDVNVAKATVADVDQNTKQLKFKTLDAAQLPQARSTVDIALIPGNYSWNANIKPSSALALEKLKNDYMEVFVVRTQDKNSKFGKAVTSVLKSKAFKDAIAKSKFKDFQKPASWK